MTKNIWRGTNDEKQQAFVIFSADLALPFAFLQRRWKSYVLF